ncbi:MAG: hypothetical protein QF752_13005 [Planctomycetota bacterium]|jgi:hypothetical protein|nr:hypothetical protein [Planctomycetota bacterium]
MNRKSIPGLVLEDPSQIARGMSDEQAEEFKNRTGILTDKPGITDEGMGHLRKITGLRTLELRHSLISDRGLGKLSLLPSLEHLGLVELRNITASGLSSLSELRTLRSAEVTGSQLGDESVVSLKEIFGLKKLKLGIRKIGNRSLELLSAKDSIEELTLMSCGSISDEGLEFIPRMSSLRILRIWQPGYSITDDGLKHIGSTKNLRVLELWDCGFGDEGVAHCERLDSIERLMIWGTRSMTNKGLISLGKLKSLEWLTLYGCINIGDEGVLCLANLYRLKKFECIQCSGVTLKSIRILKTSLPNCHIDYR